MKHDNTKLDNTKQDNRDQQRQPQQGQQHGQPQHDQKQHDQGRESREVTKAPDRDMDKNRNEEETGKPVQLGKEGRAKEGRTEGAGPQLP
jgi:hypothetical protein